MAALLDHSPGISVVGEAANGAEAIHLTLATHADVVMMDVLMPVLDGVVATRRISETPSPPAVVLMVDDGDEPLAYDAICAGACGFVEKSVDPAGLADAVLAAATGGCLVAPAATVGLVSRYTPDRSARPDVAAARARLSTGDAIVVVGVARGDDDEQIAANLGIGVADVRARIARVLEAIGRRQRSHLVVFAHESGLVSAAPAVSSRVSGGSSDLPSTGLGARRSP